MLRLKFTKDQVQFEHPGMGEDKCGKCTYYLGGRCAIVAGAVMAEDWCNRFKEEKESMNPDNTTLQGMQTREHDTIVSRLNGKTYEIKFGPQPATMEGHPDPCGGLVPANPFASKAQQGYLHAHPEKLGAEKLAEFDRASKGMKLPARAKKRGK